MCRAAKMKQTACTNVCIVLSVLFLSFPLSRIKHARRYVIKHIYTFYLFYCL